MNGHSVSECVASLACIVACAACATPLAQTPPPAAPMMALASAATAPPGPTPDLGHANIVGRIATNPWHDIKQGGVVYLEDAPKDTVVTSATLDNHDMAFVPNIAVVSAGGSVIFTNTDPMRHNVFSPDGEKWDLGQIPQNGSVTKRFDSVGSYVVLCNMHQNMRAYLVVTPSHYFARTDADGAFVIPNVPLGTYHVTAFVPRLKPVTQPVVLTGESATVNFKLER